MCDSSVPDVCSDSWQIMNTFRKAAASVSCWKCRKCRTAMRDLGRHLAQVEISAPGSKSTALKSTAVTWTRGRMQLATHLFGNLWLFCSCADSDCHAHQPKPLCRPKATKSWVLQLFLLRAPCSLWGSDKAQRETWALSLDHHVTGLRRLQTIISCANKRDLREPQLPGHRGMKRQSEGWDAEACWEKECWCENNKRARRITHPGFVFVSARQEFSVGSFAVEALGKPIFFFLSVPLGETRRRPLVSAWDTFKIYSSVGSSRAMNLTRCTEQQNS